MVRINLFRKCLDERDIDVLYEHRNKEAHNLPKKVLKDEVLKLLSNIMKVLELYLILTVNNSKKKKMKLHIENNKVVELCN